MPLNAIVLAAGKSTRFNGIKQLANLNGESLVNHTIARVDCPTINRVFVTLGAHSCRVMSQLPTHVSPLISQNWELGLGHSLADSVEQLSDFSGRLMVCLADQVAVQNEHYRQLTALSQQQPDAIIASSVNDRPCVPAIFPKRFFDSLTQLTGDQGAKELLKQHAADVVTVDCPCAQQDIDTNEDLYAYQQRQN
ncbi:MAG: nucleotidyltransferase family protein [Psychrobium sp.]